MPGRLVVLAALALIALAAPAPAAAEAPAAPAPAPAAATVPAPAPTAAAQPDAGASADISAPLTADGKAAIDTLHRLETGDAGARATALTELTKLGPRAVDAMGQYLARAHAVPVEDRRQLLRQIKAAVPDDKGNFTDPGRLAADQVREDEKFDWLAELARLDAATPGLGETFADIAALRALAATRDIHAAAVLLDAGFAPETMIYRDECGRRLRAMAPYSIPALTIASQAREPARRRYATYQLERLDRQEPAKALEAGAGDEDLRIAILDAFRTTHHREAVHAVLATVNDEAPRVRAAARRTWLAYVTGKAPPPAPKKKLQLPGGKLAEKETALWLTYRELADADLRKLSADLLGEEYGENDKVDLEAVSKKVFSHYDQERAQRDQAVYAAAKAKAEAGDLEGATVIFDQLLAQDPERAERAAMAEIYFQRARALEKDEKWSPASAAYSKAQGLAPEGPHANDALAAHHYTLGKALEAAGKDGGADFRRAIALKPDYAPAKEAAAAVESSGLHWLVYAAGLAGLGALVLLALGMRRRKLA